MSQGNGAAKRAERRVAGGILQSFTEILYLSTHKIHTWIFVERVVSLRLALALD